MATVGSRVSWRVAVGECRREARDEGRRASADTIWCLTTSLAEGSERKRAISESGSRLWSPVASEEDHMLMRRRRVRFGTRSVERRGCMVAGQMLLPESSQRCMEERSR
ncbi:hypothetical protein HPP92_011919 [Vanilla planifolia]|uniref:Uncharacterized protein n=1 Tax=Vanilla planifolia TaxID=51239 RepID=A0A835V2U6_VANPL|nr:hypothetical protein HPP92_011919 [Vanilla planifolia]